MLQNILNHDPRKRLIFDLSLILAFAVLVTLPIFFIGIPGGADMPQHFQFAKTYQDSFADGVTYPSWSPFSNSGNGDPGVRFYPPLTHIVFVLFQSIAGNWFDGFCLSIILFFFVSGTGVYFLSREWFSETASLFGAITYIVLPYHINQIYGAGMYGEFAAAAIVPFCFFLTYKVCRKGRLIDVCGLGVAFGLLILTHLPLTVICSVALLLFALFSLPRGKAWPAIFRLAIAVSMSLLLSCFYWSRIVNELNYVNHNSEAFSTGYFSFQTHFLLSKYFAFTGAGLQNISEYNDKIFLMSLGILISGAIIYFIKTRGKTDFQLFNVAALTALAIFMATPLSIVLWKNIPILQKTQFPWRWLTIIELGTAIFAAAAFAPVKEYLKSSKRPLAFIFLGLWAANIAFNVTDVMNPLITYPKDYFNPLIEKWKSMPSNDCWWPVWAQTSGKRVLSSSEQLPEKVGIKNRSFNIEKWSAIERIFIIGEGEAEPASVATFYYPHWKATVNGATTELFPTENGLISLIIPAGKTEVRLYFQEPPFVVTAFYVSGLMWIIILPYLIFNLLSFALISKSNEIDNL